MRSYKQYLSENHFDGYIHTPAFKKAGPAKYAGTAIDARDNPEVYGDRSPNAVETHIRNHLIRPENANPVWAAAKNYLSTSGYRHLLPHPSFKPVVEGTSLNKQYPIAHAYNLAVAGHPEYKKRVFEGYKENHPNIIRELHASDYDDMLHKSYEAMTKQTRGQFDHMPVRVRLHSGDLNYRHSGEMIRDIFGHSNLNVYSESGHDIMNKKDHHYGMDGNQMFRAVHDYYGHGMHGNEFGPHGEETAWAVHRKLYTPGAAVALTSETRGANSWVNYSGANSDIQVEMEHHRKERKQAMAFGDHLAAKNHHALAMFAGSHWNYAPNKGIILPHEFMDQHYRGEIPDSIKGLGEGNGKVYDAKKDHLGLKKLAVIHNTASHLKNNGGEFNAAGAQRDFEKMISLHGYSSASF